MSFFDIKDHFKTCSVHCQTTAVGVQTKFPSVTLQNAAAPLLAHQSITCDVSRTNIEIWYRLHNIFLYLFYLSLDLALVSSHNLILLHFHVCNIHFQFYLWKHTWCQFKVYLFNIYMTSRFKLSIHNLLYFYWIIIIIYFF